MIYLHGKLMSWWYGAEQAPWYLRIIAYCHARLRRKTELPEKTHSFTACIIVVGNITVGGAGKTPTVIAMAQQLQAEGYKVGVISRGYGRSSESLHEVHEDSMVSEAGDEPILIRNQLKCPVIVAQNRYQALQHLVQNHPVDVVLSDDGLQHIALPRNLEICLIDGRRGLGNGLLLPAGPLREPPEVMARIDRILYKELQPQGLPLGDVMTVRLDSAYSLESQQECDLSDWDGKVVHAVAGIGNPESFFMALEDFGIQVKRHVLRDHQACDEHQAKRWSRQGAVFITSKDAIKWPENVQANVWVVPMRVELPGAFKNWLLRSVAKQLAS